MIINVCSTSCTFVTERYNVEGQYITASGLNAGAHFAIQMQTAYSTEIHGFGSYAGSKFFH